MLTIRNAQIAILLAPQREKILQNCITSIASLFPDDIRLADARAMREIVQTAIEGAHGYGIVEGRELLLFVYLVFDQGADFETRSDQSWIGRILGDPDLNGAQKMDIIYTRLEIASKQGLR